MRKENETAFRPATLGELAARYGVSWKTFQKWMKTSEHLIGKRQGYFYTAKQVAIIFEIYGNPRLAA